MKLKKILLIGAGLLSTGFVATPPAAAQGGGDQFLGQLMLVPYTFCPRGWVTASGQILSIAQNTALFSLLGTNYGGNGQTTFGLPDLRGRVPNSTGQGPGLSSYSLGQIGGTESHTITMLEMPTHSHVGNLLGSSMNPDTPNLKKGALATFPTGGTSQYQRTNAPDTVMAAGSVTTNSAGGSQAMSLMNPYLTLQWCIAVEGIFPSRN